MSSQTIHVIGYAFFKKEGDTTTERMYYAMSRVEMGQQRKKAQAEGLKIWRWIAQTRRGARMLGTIYTYASVTEAEAPRVKLFDCDVCGAQGCPVCNHSGITTRNNKKNWSAWQIEHMRQEYGTATT